jgi:hypothetical protein
MAWVSCRSQGPSSQNRAHKDLALGVGKLKEYPGEYRVIAALPLPQANKVSQHITDMYELQRSLIYFYFPNPAQESLLRPTLIEDMLRREFWKM